MYVHILYMYIGVHVYIHVHDCTFVFAPIVSCYCVCKWDNYDIIQLQISLVM